METIGPKVNDKGILVCNGCKEHRIHDYYGEICRIGYYSPYLILRLKEENIDYSVKECPYYKEKTIDDKINDILK
jgi:hypothetical protein